MNSFNVSFQVSLTHKSFFTALALVHTFVSSQNMSFELTFSKKVSLTLTTFVWSPLIVDFINMSLHIKGMVKIQHRYISTKNYP